MQAAKGNRIKRPYVPLSVRCEVAARQLRFEQRPRAIAYATQFSKRRALDYMLAVLFDGEPHDLDHDPPLAARQRKRGKYVPDANDASYLIYRPRAKHREKTYLRGEHGQYSDLALIKREKRKRRPKRPSRKLRSANRWPAGRKLRSRPWQ